MRGLAKRGMGALARGGACGVWVLTVALGCGGCWETPSQEWYAAIELGLERIEGLPCLPEAGGAAGRRLPPRR